MCQVGLHIVAFSTAQRAGPARLETSPTNFKEDSMKSGNFANRDGYFRPARRLRLRVRR